MFPQLDNPLTCRLSVHIENYYTTMSTFISSIEKKLTKMLKFGIL